jgi:hypothetical protein
MINAREARAIMEESTSAVEAHLKNICEGIRKSAQAGNASFLCNNTSLSYTNFSHQAEKENNPHAVLQDKVISRLIDLGFKASMENDGPSYVPRAYDSDDVGAPTAQFVRLKISW